MESGASHDQSQSQPSCNSGSHALSSKQCCVLADAPVASPAASSKASDLPCLGLKRERSDSFQIPSSASSSSVGSSIAPSAALSWHGNASGSGDHMVEAAGSAERGASVSRTVTPAAGGDCLAPLPGFAVETSLCSTMTVEVSLPEGGKIGDGGSSSGSSASASRAARCSKRVGKKISIHAITGSKGMVCRHWESKGWCRYEGKCKFAHPEHKRGACPQQKPGLISEKTLPLQGGQMLPAIGGYGLSCFPFMPPAMQPLVAQPGCIYPFATSGPRA